MNIIALFIIAVAALFNIGQLPQPLPTVYQLTLNGVESVVCDSSFPSSRRGTVCNILGALRLPSAPVTLTIVAPPPPPPTASSPPVDTNSSLSDEPSPESNRRLPPSGVSTSLIVSPMVSTQSRSTWTFPTWTLPASPFLDIILTLFYCLFTTFWVGFITITIWRNEDDPRKSIVRWLTWFFYDRFKPLRRASPEGSLYYKNDAHQVDGWSYYEIRWHFFNQNSPVIRFIRPVVPEPEPPVIEEPQIEVAEPEPRKHVRSAARCQRIRRQKAKARAEQQEHAPVEEPESEAEPEVVEEPVAPRRNTRGGKQVKKRQRRQELKEARRVATNAEAGPSTRPAVVPEFNDDNFPALPGTNIEPKAVQYEYPFATIAAVCRPSPTAAIRKGSWTVKVNINPDAGAVSRPKVRRGVVGNRVEELEDRWIDLEEEVWRNGRRKRKKNR
ncbi:hypothetical protein BDY19DRAFT_925866 [Irpex rosettiformis]|uniref:Uncharacterized protein n=1 Tax=Irpex rosettiformis TaxID=378272 RepID=A0ACB8UEH2_9APHY|nr:hypothetical protein BDY19DRAFT_925866 [Irpex rosettiformis]